MDTRRIIPALLALAALAAVPARTLAQAAAPPHVVHVQLSEYRVEVPDSVKQGETVLVVTNMGSVPHSLRVRGHRGLVSTRVIEPGETVNAAMRLVAGEYTFFCGEKTGDREHRKEGMEHRVRVVW